MHQIVPPAERLRALRKRSRLGLREFAQMLGVYQVDIWDAEHEIEPVPRRALAVIDAWEAAGIEIGRPVPKITYTRGWPFDGERRKR